MLGTEGAEQLLGAGDLLYATGLAEPQRLHGPYVSAQEVETVTDSLRQHAAPRYIEGILGTGAAADATLPVPAETTVRVTSTVSTSRTTLAATSDDAVYDRAVAILVRDRSASLIQLQRRLNINPTQAAALLHRLQVEGIITPPDPSGQHQALIGQAA
jgi:DNA segregation ATPase FtsK/SpoIIIE, S-DNA-T family